MAESRLLVKVEKVTDISEIVNYGVMMTPALVVDGRVVVSGPGCRAAKRSSSGWRSAVK